MVVQDTSLQCLDDNLVTFGHRRKQVLQGLREDSLTNLELSARLVLSINCVTPRIKELRVLGLVEEAGLRKCSITGRTCHTWRKRIS